MSENPFGEGFDMGAMLAQAQQMQQQMEDLQAQLVAMTFQGSASGVTLTLTGAGEVTAVGFEPAVLDGADPEDLGDLVVAAFRDAKARADAKGQELFGPFSQALGGLGGLGA